MYGMSNSSSVIAMNLRRSVCSTQEIPCDFPCNRGVIPVRVLAFDPRRQHGSRGSMGGADQRNALRWCLAMKDFGDRIVDDFNLTRVQSPANHGTIIASMPGTAQSSPACAAARGIRGFGR